MCQSFCWRGWWRKLRGLWRASTSKYVRRSSVTTQRLRAIFASASTGVLNPFILRTTHRALPTAVPRVTGVVMLLVAHTMGRAHSGRRRGCLGGRCAAWGWHNDTPGGPCATCGGPSSVFGSGDERPVVWRANDAARQALTARAMLVLADRGPGPVRDWFTARPHRHGPFGSQRTDRRGRLLLGGHGDDEVDALTFRPDSHNCAPYLARQRCRCGTTPMGSQESLLRLPGRRVARRAGLVISTRIVYPGSGREDA